MSSAITLPKYFQSGMILQQQVKSEITGFAAPGLSIAIQWTRFPLDPHAVSPLDPRYGTIDSTTALCDGKGRFQFELPACEASFDTYELLLSTGSDSLLVRDILIGDVFLFVGELTLPETAPLTKPGQAKTSGTLPAPQPYLRHYPCLGQAQESTWSSQPQFEPDQSSPGYALYSALAQHFGRELLPEIHIPVGLVLADAPGQRIRDWAPDNRKGLFRHFSDLKNMGVRAIVWSGNPLDLSQADRLQTVLMKLATALRAQLKSPQNQPPAFILFHLPMTLSGQRHFYQQSLGNEALTFVRYHLPAPTALVPVSGIVAAHPLAVLASRLRLICLGLIYQRKAPQSAPECESLEMVGGKMILTFAHIGEGLRLTGDDSRVRGFTICGQDRVFREAQARVLFGVRVMIWHDELANPTAVTYGFYDLNAKANLESKDHLPIVPFRSDLEASTYMLPKEWLHCDDPDEWQTFAGTVKFRQEKANKSEGEASLNLSYQQEPGLPVVFGPYIDRAGDFPPLDLAAAPTLALDVFNPDRHEKSLALKILTIVAPGAKEATTHAQKIDPALRWQTLVFNLDSLDPEIDLSQVIRLQWVIHDKTGRGQLNIDNIRQIYT